MLRLDVTDMTDMANAQVKAPSRFQLLIAGPAARTTTTRPMPNGVSLGCPPSWSLPSCSRFTHAGYSFRETVPQRIPDKPPFLAHLGNLDYEIMEEDIRDFLDGCDVTSVRLIEDRETKRPKGFGYAEFSNVEGLKKALALDGTSYRGRSIKVKIADPRMYIVYGVPRVHIADCLWALLTPC